MTVVLCMWSASAVVVAEVKDFEEHSVATHLAVTAEVEGAGAHTRLELSMPKACHLQ